MNAILEKLYTGSHLNNLEAKSIFSDLFAGKLDPVQISSLLTALKMNGYSAGEIGGAASAMLEAADPFERSKDIAVGEIVGTGGDRLATFNISTLSALTASLLGLRIAKHGNTAVSSKTGASDFLDALGYNIRAGKRASRKNLEEEGFAFFFAQMYHPGMRFAGPVRKSLGTSTLFNILGPLGNPARVDYELLGCYDEKLLPIMAQAMHVCGIARGMTVNGSGMDEISVSAPTKCVIVHEDGCTKERILRPEDFGIRRAYSQSEMIGGTPQENAEIGRRLLAGKGTDAQNAAVAANTAALLLLSGQSNDLKEGFASAMDAILSGQGVAKLEAVCATSRLPL